MDLILQPLFHLLRQRRYFFYIFNLSIDHCPLVMLLFFNRNDLHLIFHNYAHHSDDAARPDVQGNYHIIRLYLCLCLGLHFSLYLYWNLFRLSFRHDDLLIFTGCPRKITSF